MNKLFKIIESEVRSFVADYEQDKIQPEFKGCGVNLVINDLANYTNGLIDKLTLSFTKEYGQIVSYGEIWTELTEAGKAEGLNEFVQLNRNDYNGPFFRRYDIDKIVQEIVHEVECQLKKQNPKDFVPMYQIQGSYIGMPCFDITQP